MATWTLDLRNLSGTPVATSVANHGFKVNRVLDAPGSLEVEVPWNSDVAAWGLYPRLLREYIVRRDGVAYAGGYIWRLGGNASGRTASAQGEGFFSVLRHAQILTDLRRVDQPAHEIAWALINSWQQNTAAGRGFTQGTHTGASQTRTKLYCGDDGTYVADAIEELAQLRNGFDFEIAPDKTFDTWTGTRGTATGISFTGADEYDLDWTDDLSDALSDSRAGSNEECGGPIGVVSDAAARTAFGRLDGFVESESEDSAHVTRLAQAELDARKTGITSMTVSFDADYGPAWGTYDIGDTVSVAVSENWASFTKTMLIAEVGVTVESPDVATIELGLVMP